MKKRILLFLVLFTAVILSSCSSHAYCPAYADNSTEDTEKVTS